jgi:hypothetical protein
MSPGEHGTAADSGSAGTRNHRGDTFAVHNAAGAFVRLYSVADHGEDAGKLAEQFANKIGGKVVVGGSTR